MSETLIAAYIGAVATVVAGFGGVWWGTRLSSKQLERLQCSAESFETIMSERTDALLKAQHDDWMRKMDEAVQGMNARLKTHAGEIVRALRQDKQP